MSWSLKHTKIQVKSLNFFSTYKWLYFLSQKLSYYLDKLCNYNKDIVLSSVWNTNKIIKSSWRKPETLREKCDVRLSVMPSCALWWSDFISCLFFFLFVLTIVLYSKNLLLQSGTRSSTYCLLQQVYKKGLSKKLAEDFIKTCSFLEPEIFSFMKKASVVT